MDNWCSCSKLERLLIHRFNFMPRVVLPFFAARH